MPCPLGFKYKKRSALARLTASEVRKARRDLAEKRATQVEIAQRLGLSQSAVSMLERRITYQWVGDGVKAA